MTVNDYVIQQLDAKACREWEQGNRFKEYLCTVIEQHRQPTGEDATPLPAPPPAKRRRKRNPQPAPVLSPERYEAEQRRWMQILWGRPAMTPRETVVFTVPHNHQTL